MGRERVKMQMDLERQFVGNREINTGGNEECGGR